MTEADALKIASQFDALPDDAVVPPKVAEILSGGNYSEQEWRRNPPVPRRQISERRIGFRVGDLRALFRGKFPIEPSVSPRHHSRKGKFSHVAESA